jgi:hypothetical protein
MINMELVRRRTWNFFDIEDLYISFKDTSYKDEKALEK